MEEDHNFGCSDKLAEEMGEDCRRGLSGFVEENPEAFDDAQIMPAEFISELEMSSGILLYEMRGREPVGCFGLPLFLLSKAPQDQDTREDTRKRESEPSSVRSLFKSRREVKAIQTCDCEPWEKHQVWAAAPYNQCSKSYHACIEERDKHDTDTRHLSAEYHEKTFR